MRTRFSNQFWNRFKILITGFRTGLVVHVNALNRFAVSMWKGCVWSVWLHKDNYILKEQLARGKSPDYPTTCVSQGTCEESTVWGFLEWAGKCKAFVHAHTGMVKSREQLTLYARFLRGGGCRSVSGVVSCGQDRESRQSVHPQTDTNHVMYTKICEQFGSWQKADPTHTYK